MDQLRYHQAEKRMRMAAIIFSMIVATFITGTVLYKEEVNAQAKLQENIAEEVLRFHVLANSDSQNDQFLKMKVKEAVLTFLEENMPDAADVEKTKEWIRTHTDEIEAVSESVVKQEGCSYTVSAAVTTCWFPDKTYGDVTFPQGNYKALRVEIGEAKGQNWWCVLYPGLCFLNAANAVVPEAGKQKLKDVLTEEEYSCLTMSKDFHLASYFMENILTF